MTAMRSRTEFLDHLVPGAGRDDASLNRRLERDSARRLRRVRSGLDRLLRSRAFPLTGRRRDLLADASRLCGQALRPAASAGTTALRAGLLRGWLFAAEDALALATAALAARADRPSRRGAIPASWLGLLDSAAEAGELPRIAPGGRLTRRSSRHALDRAAAALAGLAGGFPRAAPPAGRAGRPAGGPRGPSHLRVGAAVRTTLRGPVRAGGSRRDPRFARRVDGALALLDTVWPAAAAMVLDRTHLVVPVLDPGTVSFSSRREPGVAYVNIRSAPRLRLAEDLLHEATHMRLHAIESVVPLFRDVTGSSHPTPRFVSPWRRGPRPLRGVVHGCCTFLVGAWLFERTLRACAAGEEGPPLAPSRRAWLVRRRDEEMDNVAAALRSLRRGHAEDFLTAAGRRLLDTVDRERARLVRAARPRRRRASC